MSTVTEIDDIEETATHWVMRLDGGALQDAEQSELDAWLAADTRHLGAFVRAQAAWVHLDRVAALAAGRAPVKQEPVAWQWQRAAAVAAVALGVLASLAFVNSRYLAGRESTQVGEVRRLTLADGSALSLNTSSVLQVKFAEDERRIVLRQGEASFQVAHDEQRPFVVQAGNVSVRAVGTAFSVRMRSQDVEVVVTEGVVEVARRGGGTARIAAERVARNQEVVVTTAKQPEAAPLAVAALSENEIERRLSWQDGRLVFQGEALANAVAEVNRYSPLPVVIDDAALGRKSFVGVFRVGDTRAFAQAAATAFDAHVHEEDGALHLRN
jgi:transmembrane sensor